METPIKKEEEEEVEVNNIETHLHIDAKSLYRNFQHLDFILSLKSRFLMGLCTRESLLQTTIKQSALPESFLRNDDVSLLSFCSKNTAFYVFFLCVCATARDPGTEVLSRGYFKLIARLFYDDVKILVERCFGGCNVETQQCMFPDDVQLFDLRNISRTILRRIDDLSNYGLYNLAKLLTRGLVTFVKTRPQMKRVIKSSLIAIQSNQYPTGDQVKFHNELSRLLKSPNNFRQNYRKHVKLTLKSHRVHILKVLDGLKDMNFHTLTAMHRKLKGSQRTNPQLYPCPSRKTKELLIKQITKRSFDMIQLLDESDELQEPLVKAMAVAGLSLNVASCSQDLSVPKFIYVTPELSSLQDEIVKAIQLLDKRLRKHEMEKLRQLLDPDSTAVGKSLKSAIRNMLTDFLYDCIDMDAVPDSLLAALSLINKRLSQNAGRSLSKDLMNEDVECILNVSAYLKQLVWKCDPSQQLDQDFLDAYMDEAEESDDGDIADDSDDDQKLPMNSTDGSQMRFNDFSEEVGSTSYADDACFVSPSTCEANFENRDCFASSKVVDDVCSDTETSQGELFFSTIFKGGSSPLISPGLVDDCTATRKQDSFKDTAYVLSTRDNCSKHKEICGYQKNHYVTVQEVCDNASVVAFDLIGCLLSEFAHLEALCLDQNEESYLRGGESRPEHFQDAIENSRDNDVSGSIVVEAVHKVLPSFSKRPQRGMKKKSCRAQIIIIINISTISLKALFYMPKRTRWKASVIPNLRNGKYCCRGFTKNINRII
ncbi:hypothetical protein KSS87_008270 [Heliosperma pusillum]|nr:hypothetical protein KSS87_008270 [Heliosperma pusillum]